MIRTFLLSLLALVVCSSAQAADPYVTGTYRPVSQGWRAEFTLHNALEDETIFMWYAVTADAGDVGTPAGWHIRQDYRKVGWDANSVADRLQPGASLSGYNFTSQSSNRVNFPGLVAPFTIRCWCPALTLSKLNGQFSVWWWNWCRRGGWGRCNRCLPASTRTTSTFWGNASTPASR